MKFVALVWWVWLQLAFRDCDGVRVTRLSVPRAYILDNYHREHREQDELAAAGDSKAIYRYDVDGDDEMAAQQRDLDGRRHHERHLILDCEYEIDAHEKGFVLKWYFNGRRIYQWIPPGRPFGSGAMKHQVNSSYTVSDEKMHKHRALALIKPLKNFTGEYTCAVSTFQSEDSRSAGMLIIVPESSFMLRYHSSNISNLVMVLCSVYGIFPLPTLSLWINEHQLENVTTNVLLTQAELYDSSIRIQLVLYESIQPDDVIKCMLVVNGTEYSKTKNTVFIDVNSKPIIEHNSVLDPVISAVETNSASSDSSTTPSPTTSTMVYDTTTAMSTTSSEEANQPVTKWSSTVVVPPVVERPQQTIISRSRPTSGRVLTVHQAVPNADPDEGPNEVEFKVEFPFKENMLYSSGGSGAQTAGCWMLLRILALTITTCSLLMMKRLRSGCSL
ncbi:uncharacterized protein LOC129765121 [Toxorhynchites rutilus septentrionalis]|uniref:uncharacterized protein LOC129765121 n=1 Tax=Toxorhynchites rutilus septentrionalis TaxID=329112 RepID=UPI00247A48CA|nr:uncharacterized protein LOC129765121 [Toxorhynchites rutilus septentrionalis]